MTERYRTVLHAYVLMENHYHLLLETPEANLSAAAQWLNVSYSQWFRRREAWTIRQPVLPSNESRWGDSKIPISRTPSFGPKSNCGLRDVTLRKAKCK
jgi:REP element-mobilizing transposase RayT